MIADVHEKNWYVTENDSIAIVCHNAWELRFIGEISSDVGRFVPNDESLLDMIVDINRRGYFIVCVRNESRFGIKQNIFYCVDGYQEVMKLNSRIHGALLKSGFEWGVLENPDLTADAIKKLADNKVPLLAEVNQYDRDRDV